MTDSYPIFCPTCATLLLDAPACPSCGWARPAVAGAGDELWRAGFDLPLGRSPVMPAVVGGAYCLAAADGTLSARSVVDGAPLWRRRLSEHAAPADLCPAGDMLVVGLVDTRPIPAGERPLLALDPRSGAEVWRRGMGAHSVSAAAAAGDMIYCTTSDGQLHAVGADGRAGWSAPVGAWGPAAPAVGGGLVVAGGRANSLVACDAATGAERWRFAGEGWFAGALYVQGGLLVTLGWDSTLYALRCADGALAWRAHGERGRGFSSPPCLADGRVFIGDRVQQGGRASYALRALSAADGRELWRRPTEHHITQPPIAAGDVILCADGSRLLALGVADGALRWQAALDTAPATSFALGDNLIAFALASQTLLAVSLGAAAAPARPNPAELLARGDRAGAAAAYALAGDLACAAEIYAELARPREAAQLYERAGLPEALLLRLGLEHWEQAAALAERLGDYEQAAGAYERLGRRESAAMAYERAAQQLAARAGGADLAADQYEKAARLYADQGDLDRAALSQREVHRYRALPDLVAVGRAQGAFVERAWNILDVQVENVGFGPAYNITIDVGGRFEASGAPPLLRSLALQRNAVVRLPLRAQPGQFGPAVPLELIISYADCAGRTYEEREQIFIPVVQEGRSPQPEPPVEITVRTSHPQPADAPPAPTQRDLTLEARFIPQGGGRAQVLWGSSIGSSHTSSFTPPFRGDDLSLVMRALDYLQAASALVGAADLARLAALGLPVSNDQIDPNTHRAVGRALMRALTADPKAGELIATVRNMARAYDQQVVVQLRFPLDAVELAALPWELLWGEGDVPVLLDRGQLTGCTRHIEMDAAIAPLRPRGGPLRILAIAPLAGVDQQLRQSERQGRQIALAPMIAAGQVAIHDMEPPVTVRRLFDQIQDYQPHVIHVVGHGRYVGGRGALIFDKEQGGKEVVPAARVAQLFSGARMVLLHACQGAMVGEAGLLTGVGPAISAAGVPAVVAMQLSVRVGAALRFAEVLYRTLAHGEPLQRAVSRARQALYVEEPDGASWYVPTLTITSRETGPFYL